MKTAPLLAILALAACRVLPEAEVTPNYAIEPSADVALAQVTEALSREHGVDKSGFFCLTHGDSALRWRLILIDQAEQSIDIQYYIWHGASGLLVLDHLFRAADRGVRVRVLVEDYTLEGSDVDLARLGSYPNFELRLFNPANVRSGGLAGVIDRLSKPKALNQRMHNKLLVADNHVAILGGRNIGDEYFGLNEGFNHLDLDVVTAGPVVPQVSERFDSYWNSELAYPVEALAKVDEDGGREVRARVERDVEKQRPTLVSFQADGSWPGAVHTLPQAMIAARETDVLWDDVTGEGKPDQVGKALKKAVESAESEMTLMVAYVIPVPEFVDLLRRAVERGVKVTILTNSLASLDNPTSNAFYKKYRVDMLEVGVDLHEVRPDARDRAFAQTFPIVEGVMGMHTKLMIIDRRHVFVGSFNLEPRAVHYNRENGLLVDSPELARELGAYADLFLEQENSWQLRLDENGHVHWHSYDGVLNRPPARSDWQRLRSNLIGTLPIPSKYL